MVQKIKEFIGKNGFIPFEHGYRTKYVCSLIWGISDTEVYFGGGRRDKLEECDPTFLNNIYKELISYFKFCNNKA